MAGAFKSCNGDADRPYAGTRQSEKHKLDYPAVTQRPHRTSRAGYTSERHRKSRQKLNHAKECNHICNMQTRCNWNAAKKGATQVAKKRGQHPELGVSFPIGQGS